MEPRNLDSFSVSIKHVTGGWLIQASMHMKQGDFEPNEREILEEMFTRHDFTVIFGDTSMIIESIIADFAMASYYFSSIASSMCHYAGLLRMFS